MDLKLKILVITLFLFSILLRSIGFYDTFYGIEFLKDSFGQQYSDFGSLENIIYFIPALFSLSGILLYYFCYKRHLKGKYFNANEIIDSILILYVFFDVSISIMYWVLENTIYRFG
ncbi:hypothetical protein [Brumimicrobium oceani]|uniref:Uncharacterized protein n=1 Tax=Brumimicrobium oceani TaxID=2100725 RepID=A0A2U2XH90_9FLAO|nr:hypothetical protein [Brumimicrobium oceani]PWH87168.1 hypothetical protein DIT68_02585 [Brumimicrobium oceani]